MAQACRYPVVAGVALLMAGLAAAPARAEDANEFWPEAQLQYWFNDHQSRLIGLVASGRNRDTDATYQAEQGVQLEHQFTSYFLGRVGYEHASATDGSGFFENRALLEQTFRLYLPAQVIAEYRTREDFRWLNSGFSARLREASRSDGTSRSATTRSHRTVRPRSTSTRGTARLAATVSRWV